MHTTSSTWKNLMDNPLVSKNEKLVIANQTYYNSKMFSGGVVGDLMSEPEDVGNAISRQLSVVLEPLGLIPRAAKIEYYVQLTIRGSNNAIVQSSEWIRKGIFYIDTREEDPETGLLNIVAFDKMMSAETPYLHSGYVGDWPRTDIDVVDDICTLMGITLDSNTRSFINKSYQIPYPGVDDDGLTKREILSNIGVLYCGNFMITDDETLRLVPLEGLNPIEALTLNRDMNKIRTAEAFPPYSCVTMYDESDREYTSGSVSTNTRELYLSCPWATQAAVDNILTRIQNLSYKPYTAQRAFIDPAYELGDQVIVTNTLSVLNSMSWNFGRSLLVNLSTPFDQEVDHEYPYDATLSREVKRKVSLGKSYYGVTITKEEGIRVDRDDGKSEAVFNSDVFSMRALIDGAMRDRIYFDPVKGDYVFDGALGADAVFTDSLYAEVGDVSELTVDRLSTSRRVRKFILSDTSDDNYITIQDNYVRFITGRVQTNAVLATTSDAPLLTSGGHYLQVMGGGQAGLITQAKNRNNQPLYWQREPVSHTADGYPLDSDGKQIYATTETTDWPVYQYVYKELVKASFTFAAVAGQYQPQIILGAGDENGNSKGFIYKTPTGLDVIYKASSGDELSVKFGDSGYVDVNKMRRPISYDFSHQDEISEVVDGNVYLQYALERDAQGRITKITNLSDGHETVVNW